ncbi:hypothetical protein PHLCEN_2v1310 [Hermanssonia centrifuga]|uniref:COX15-CtaA-domain-containing protein n=1 Tax=Hermanssonia centrifuga TaxID=98765 RepID=A0A2R6S3N8_9APHY|nr:hypothetical protein PHLCEN_2v1310 [Hermanssonia centrifuga]
MLLRAWARAVTSKIETRFCLRALNNAQGPLLRSSSGLSTKVAPVLQALQRKQTISSSWCKRTLFTQTANSRIAFFSTNPSVAAQPLAELPILSPPPVAIWLLASSALVFAVIVVGGVTRLTESGLSITEWRPVSGILPPLSQAEWEGEFMKYKATPEFKLMNHSMNLSEFKEIFYMEWGHRVLGRIIGVAFVVPLAYFAIRRRLTASLPKQLAGMALLLGAQGALGWYMVKSGLEDSLMDTPGAVPRVSQYRLAAHLGTAFVLYAGMFGTGIAALMDWRYAKTGSWGGLKKDTDAAWENILKNPHVRRFARNSKALTALVFITALSGQFSDLLSMLALIQ